MSALEYFMQWIAEVVINPDEGLKFTLTITQTITVMYILYNYIKTKNMRGFLKTILTKLLELTKTIEEDKNKKKEYEILNRKLDLIIELYLNELKTKYSPSDKRYLEVKNTINLIKEQLALEKEEDENSITKLEEVIGYVSSLIKG